MDLSELDCWAFWLDEIFLCSLTNLKFASSLTHFRYSYILYDFSCLGVLWQFPFICVYAQHKYVSVPCAELSLVRLADSPLVDPFTEQPVAGVSGIFKTQFPKDSLNF